MHCTALGPFDHGCSQRSIVCESAHGILVEKLPSVLVSVIV